MKNLNKIKKDFGVGVLYVPCECRCTCDYGDTSGFSSKASDTKSDNFKFAN